MVTTNQKLNWVKCKRCGIGYPDSLQNSDYLCATCKIYFANTVPDKPNKEGK